MATVKQLRTLEAQCAAEFSRIMKSDGYQAANASGMSVKRWHMDALAQAREYRFRAPTVRREFGNEEAVNEIVIKADYEPHQQDADQDWTQLDEDNKVFLTEWHLPLTHADCVASGDTTSKVALYLEARDMVIA